MLRYWLQVRSRLLRRNAWPDARYDSPVLHSVEAPSDPHFRRLLGHPELRSAPRKTRRFNAHESPRNPIELESFSNPGRVGAELLDPGPVAHHKNGRGICLIISRLERTAQEWCHPVKFESALGDVVAGEKHAVVTGVVDHILLQVGYCVLKDVRVPFHFLKLIEQEHPAPVICLVEVAQPDGHQLA